VQQNCGLIVCRSSVPGASADDLEARDRRISDLESQCAEHESKVQQLETCAAQCVGLLAQLYVGCPHNACGTGCSL
jgi:hypothetical protein